MAEYLLAYDLGTTGNKAILVEAATGKVAASAFASYPTYYTGNGGAEQSPDDWWASAIETSRQLSSQAPHEFSQIVAVGVGGMMNGLVLTDPNGMALRPAIIHADTRSAAECRALTAQLGARAIFDATSNRPDPHLTLPKAMWLKSAEPALFSRAGFIVQAKDYLVGRLTGAFGLTDPSDASLTGGFDVRHRVWAIDLWDAAGIPRQLLPEVVPSTRVIGQVTPDAASATGLKSGLPVVMGAGDGACATAGSGVATGEAYAYLGGTSWIGLLLDRPLEDDRLSAYCALDERVTAFGTVQAAGSSVDWIGQILGIESAGFAEMDQAAAQVEPGAGNLFFLPYLQGERAPLWDSDARGVFFGLSSSHTRAHLFRAVIEGVCFALRSILDVFSENGFALPALRILGGGAKSALWREILADCTGRGLVTVADMSSATSLGAAIAAGVGVGLYPSVADAARRVQVGSQTEPNPAVAETYARRYEFFRSLYPALRERFQALAALSKGEE